MVAKPVPARSLSQREKPKQINSRSSTITRSVFKKWFAGPKRWMIIPQVPAALPIQILSVASDRYMHREQDCMIIKMLSSVMDFRKHTTSVLILDINQ